MLDVADYERICRMVQIEGKTQRQVAEELGHSRNLIAKALAHSSPPSYRRQKPPPRPVLDSFLAIIDAWVAADGQQPRKQRHSGTRIYERLRDEYSYTGSVSAVRRYLAQCKQRQGEVFFPLQFDVGEEGQVDWGETWCVLNGVEQKVFLFCLRLCYSSVSYVRAYYQESQEYFQDGHVHAFDFLGGVPRRLAYDNLKSAVITVGQGSDRRLNRHFVALRSHYLFETRFCNVASGNEKGHVENRVKHSQRTFMTPLPCVASLEALNVHLEQQCRNELDKKAPRRQETRGALLEEEQGHFLALPPTPLPLVVSNRPLPASNRRCVSTRMTTLCRCAGHIIRCRSKDLSIGLRSGPSRRAWRSISARMSAINMSSIPSIISLYWRESQEDSTTVALSKGRPGEKILSACAVSWSIAMRAKALANTSTSSCCLPVTQSNRSGRPFPFV